MNFKGIEIQPSICYIGIRNKKETKMTCNQVDSGVY